MRSNSISVPLFLRKTYELINTCDPDVSSWSSDGLTFAVKDVERFQLEFIPKFFKHNNFSSFVRQLNFYGFHKVRADPLLIDDAEVSEESKFWKFHHDKFQRGRPELLAEIRKNTKAETAGKKDVEYLRNDAANLRYQVSGMKRELDTLKEIVESHVQRNLSRDIPQGRSSPVVQCMMGTASKKMRFSNEPQPVTPLVASHDAANAPLQAMSTHHVDSAVVEDRKHDDLVVASAGIESGHSEQGPASNRDQEAYENMLFSSDLPDVSLRGPFTHDLAEL